MSKKTETARDRNLVAFDIIRFASGWLRRHLPDRFGTAEPSLDPDGGCWRAPVVLTYPGIVIGQVGELVLDARTGEVVNHTEIQGMKARAMRLWKRHHAKVKAAVLRTRNR
jgi:hypothetical protein